MGFGRIEIKRGLDLIFNKFKKYVASQHLHAIMGTQLRKVSLAFQMHWRGGEAVEGKIITKTLPAFAAERK